MIHFISGLPRSGSTLLSALLRQNPRFHASITSPVGRIFCAVQEATSQSNESAVFLNDQTRYRLLESIFHCYYENCACDVKFDTNRLWTTKLPILKTIFPYSKMLACVRDPAWIIDSIESLLRETPQLSGLFGFHSEGTLFSRVETLIAKDGLLGFAYDGLREAVYGPYRENIALVRYESLVEHPHNTMAAIYAFLGEKYAEGQHDFEHVIQPPGLKEFDARLGTPGLHRVYYKVRPPTDVIQIPPDLVKRFRAMAFWESNPAPPCCVI